MIKNKFLKNQIYGSASMPIKPIIGGKAAYAAKVFSIILVVACISLAAKAGFNKSTSNEQIQPSALEIPVPVSSLAIPNPTILSIPSIKVTASFEALGIQPNSTIEVPKNNMGVGWFIYGAKPGEIGASVIVGHLDSAQGRAVFADLYKIKPGSKIIITREDASIVIYRVDYLSKFSQNKFPTQAVYGSIPYAGLRLITCSGTWNKKAGHYSDNLVVFASQIN